MIFSGDGRTLMTGPCSGFGRSPSTGRATIGSGFASIPFRGLPDDKVRVDNFQETTLIVWNKDWDPAPFVIVL